jgi:hypothetical protein
MNQKRRAQHEPVRVGELGGLEFYRCSCGFTLAKFKGGLFWIRATPKDTVGLGGGIRQIRNADELARALATNCQRRHRLEQTCHAPRA